MSLSVDDVATHVERHRAAGMTVCKKMTDALDEIGFTGDDLSTVPEFDQADFKLITDPYSQKFNLTGYWYDSHRHKIGQIQFLEDGSFYAEYDVVKPHPTKKQWFVEAMTAWGRDGQIKTEPKLLSSLV